MPASEKTLAAYVRGIMERDRVSAASLEQQQRFRPESPEAARGALREEDLEALRKVERDEPLTPHDRFRLEAVVVPDGFRPSFDVRNDTFERLSEPWIDVETRRSTIEPMIRGIGRLNLVGHPSLPFGGTAFVVAPDLLMTNRHAAEFFVDGRPAGALQFKPGMSSEIDLKEEVDSATSVIVRVREAVHLSADWDAALLRVAPLPDGVRPLPLAGAPASTVDGRVAVVIGYPAIDPLADVIQQINIFRGVFDKKRLTPGRLMGFRPTLSVGRTVNALAHDCTTVGGNSGSAVIDVNLGAVVGLHFSGDQFVANYSVPVWELADDPLVVSAGVTFV